MSPRVRAARLALLSVVVLSAALAAVPGAAITHDGTAAQQTTVEAPPIDETTIVIRLRADGDARWTISKQYNVSTDERRSAFREVAARFEERQMGLDTLHAFRQAAALAENDTGRPMEVTDEELSSDVETGSLNTSFTWTNFVRKTDEAHVVGDVFNTSSQQWFGGLTADQTLIVELPPNYGVRSAPRPVQNGRLRWDGPTTFQRGELEIIYSGNGPQTPTPTTVTTTSTPATSLGETPEGGPPLMLGGFFALGIGILVVGVYVLSRHRDGFDASGGSGGDGSPDEGPSTPAAADAVTEPAEPEDDEIDEELLSDEERVERLLESNGGRMKQANIVTETGWSNAKVSQLLSSMEEEGRIDKLRIGRENLISFPDEDVTEFDEE